MTRNASDFGRLFMGVSFLLLCATTRLEVSIKEGVEYRLRLFWCHSRALGVLCQMLLVALVNLKAS